VLWRSRQCEYFNLSFPLQFIEYIVDQSPFSSSSLRETSANARQGIDVTGVLSLGFRFAHDDTIRTRLFGFHSWHRSMIIRGGVVKGEVKVVTPKNKSSEVVLGPFVSASSSLMTLA